MPVTKEFSTRPQVALIVETSVVYGREILRGISRYLGPHNPWSVVLDERELDAPAPDWLESWEGDGVICRSTTPDLIAHMRERRIPLVDLNDRFGDLGGVRIASDMAAIGEMAAADLLSRNYLHVAFCGFRDELWSALRLEGIRRRVEPVSVFESPWRVDPAEDRAEIRNWLSQLPRPVGIVACNDARGFQVLDACRSLKLVVPEEVAVLGVDNAETFCALCDPPLSSVVPDAEKIGYLAAATLSRLLHREHVPAEQILVPPRGIVHRASTDATAIGDPLVARATQFLRENCTSRAGVADLERHFKVSRSTLERRFRQAVGRSPHEQLTDLRLKRVMTLLEGTRWPVSRIAAATGFDHPEYLMVQFKRLTGQTPTQWRLAKKLSNAP